VAGAGGESEVHERRLVPILLLVMAATGIIDAACLLHLGVFTAYLTGSLILFGAHLAGATGYLPNAAFAVVALLTGSVVGIVALRRARPSHHLSAMGLGVVAILVLSASAVAATVGLDDDAGTLATISVLGFAMGIQLAVVRTVAVTDLALPALTLAVFNIIADTPLGGARPQRTGRRAGLVATLVGGAAVGAGIARWQPPAAWAAAAAVIAVAAVLTATSRGT
jgi:uncharacterized membrane protein YoaK (UPF0700 family)